MAQAYVSCANNFATEEEIMNALHVKTNTGVVGIRAMIVNASAANIIPMVNCDGILLDKLQIWRNSIGLTVDGKPAVVFIVET